MICGVTNNNCVNNSLLSTYHVTCRLYNSLVNLGNLQSLREDPSRPTIPVSASTIPHLGRDGNHQLYINVCKLGETILKIFQNENTKLALASIKS